MSYVPDIYVTPEEIARALPFPACPVAVYRSNHGRLHRSAVAWSSPAFKLTCPEPLKQAERSSAEGLPGYWPLRRMLGARLPV